MKSIPRKKALFPTLHTADSSQKHLQAITLRRVLWGLAGLSLVLAMIRLRMGFPSLLLSPAGSPEPLLPQGSYLTSSVQTFTGMALLTLFAIATTWVFYHTLMAPPNRFEEINHKHFLQILFGSILLFLIVISGLTSILDRAGTTPSLLSSNHYLLVENIEILSILLIGNTITLLLGEKSATLFFLISSMILSLIPTTPFGGAILPLLAGPLSSRMAMTHPGRMGSLQTGLASGLSLSTLSTALCLITGSLDPFAMETAAFTLVTAMLLFPMSASVIMPVLEKSIGVISEASLTELLDLNHPLLQEFSRKAPGSFYHSLAVAQIAESAAFAIGENTKLARVSAYFHDVGKMDRPQYFIENQATFNRHELLTPRMSSMILIDHVRKGIEIARHYRLPDPIVSAIPEHHGTRVMQYFLRKSLEGANTPAQPAHESDFRYPGPKPQTKITAIIMMADAIEATGRAVKVQDSAPARIISVIDDTINDILRDGQLDECPLTISDIARLKEVFVRTLLQSQHKRILYPGGKAEASKPQGPLHAR